LSLPLCPTLHSVDEDLALRIQDNMFDFENLVDLDNRSIQILMRTLRARTNGLRTEGGPRACGREVPGAICLSATGAMFLDEMEMMGMVRVSDAEEAQRNIIRQARKLAGRRREIILASADGGGFV
jgi:flagellar motor switch protein FliG